MSCRHRQRNIISVEHRRSNRAGFAGLKRAMTSQDDVCICVFVCARLLQTTAKARDGDDVDECCVLHTWHQTHRANKDS